MRLLTTPFMLALLLSSTACSSPQILRVERSLLAKSVPATRVDFSGGAGLTLIADQGVRGWKLDPAEQGFLLEWEGLEGGSWSQTLQPQEGMTQVGGPLGNRVGSAYALLMHGNGEIKLALAEDEDLRVRYGVNALAYLGITMNGSKIMETLNGAPAEKAGAQPGDVLKGITRRGAFVPLQWRISLAHLLPELHPGETVTLVVEREGERIELPVQLGTRPLEVWNKTDG